jgi:hypothetical protein
VPLSFDQITAEYFFSTWNWPIIRKSCSWIILSALIGMFCVAIAMVATLPKQCDPEHMWWQSATVYEIFPGSFQVSFITGRGYVRHVEYNDKELNTGCTECHTAATLLPCRCRTVAVSIRGTHTGSRRAH